ncbi:ATP-dependent DNA helicase UvrD2 [Kineosporia sp. J2-2]|uniref:DNA 3'-5' helicase n=1 Tax=Kineosporia corallincola TaxID=2835133 RepID=A0ABS5TEI3_9ACTN|nr:UvrD-helicase domain-containing protein [Kineosporia corallincola]MBT0768009.1 ATP-dependent DNA helicase UvrD2 [Kineosporia corallincola]
MTIPARGADGMLEGLDPEQREVALAVRGPVCVLAGAGTGKTRAITHRIAYGVHSGIYVPQQVLAVTFTARAAGEMRTRLRQLGVGGVQARTFHAAALRQLGYFYPRVIGGRPPELLEHKARMVADAAARLRLTVDRAAVRDLAAEIEWSKVSLLTPESYVRAARTAGRGEPGGFPVETVSRLIGVYEETKTDRGMIDFEDVLLLMAGIIETQPQVANEVRGQYRHFVVDEYQDVSALQQRLLDQWLGDRKEVCVVGDPSQTIYSFTGASADHLLRFPQNYPDAQVVRLVRDYRSTPQIVSLANRLLARRVKTAGPAPLELRSQRESGPAPRLTSHDDDAAEAAAVAKQVSGLLDDGVRAREIAVLFRTNSQSEQVEQALADAGLPYQLRGGERFFARKEVREAVMLIRGAARGGLGDGTLGEATRDVLSHCGWTPQAPSGVQAGGVRERWESLQALAALADDLAATRPDATLADLVAELDERAAAQHAPSVEGVTLASLHAAKGLEWDAVFLVGLSEGLMPISFAEGWDAIEEERRLFYVGITRAREHLHLSWSRARTGGRGGRNPSRFLEGIFPDAGERDIKVREPSRKTAAHRPPPALCKICGRALTSAVERKVGRCSACPAGYDEQTLQRLRDWRAAAAEAARMPAYVIFTDATLMAIAEAAPAEPGELAAVPGVGVTKQRRWGDDVLAVLSGTPWETP